MKKIKRFAALVLAMCLLWAMVPTIPFAAATGEDGSAVLTQIQIDALPVKTQYWTGESLDTAGLVLLALYSDGSVQQVTEGYTLSGFHNSLTGQQTVTVTYQGKTAEFTVTVNAPEVTAIDIGQPPRKIEYWTGETLDTDGLTLTVFYSDSSVVEISEGFTVTGFDSAAAGEQTLTASYMGKTVSFAVTVKKPEVTAINIMEPPEKTNYWTGEALDTEGLVLIVSYTDGNTAQITQGYTISGFDSTQPGTQSVQVSYMGKTTAFTVTVNKLEVVKIEVCALPEKTVYWTGEALDTKGLVLRATYQDGTVSQITEGFTVTGFDSTQPGTMPVVVFYGDASTEFTVTVNALELTDIQVISPPAKTQYWIGEALDITGLVLEVTFSDGRKQQTDKDFTVFGFNSDTAGQKPLRIYYQDYEDVFAVFSVTVKKPSVSSVAIKTLPDKTEYFVGEELDLTGLTLTATFSDGSTAVVSSGFTPMSFNSSTVGTKTVMVYYITMTKLVRITVTVKERCDHTDVENGICTQCNAAIAATVTDSSGNTIGNYTDMTDALKTAVSGNTIVLLNNTTATDLVLPAGVHLNLNGFVLQVDSILTYGNSVISDSSAAVSGLLKITQADGNMISLNNSCLPVYDSAAGGYRFFCVTVTPKAVTGNHKYWFRIDIGNFEAFYPLIQSGAQVLFQVKMTWDGQETDAYAKADMAFTAAWAEHYQANRDVYITVSVAEAEGLENFRLTPGITSGGVAVFGEEME